MSGTVKEVKSKEELDGVVKSGAPTIVHFWASWCDASKHMDQVFSHLSTDFPLSHFLRVIILLILPFCVSYCVVQLASMMSCLLLVMMTEDAYIVPCYFSLIRYILMHENIDGSVKFRLKTHICC